MNYNILLLVLSFPLLSESLNCDKVFNYYENYGQNGFDVTCHGLVKGYENILENIAIYSEITLTIIDSLLYNVTSKIFHNIRNIRQLYLTNSTFVFDKKLAVFRELNQLEKLHVENTNFNITSSTFQGLKGLKELVLKNNSIDLVNSESFKNLPGLEVLEISRNKIKQLSDVPICQLTNLKEINFESNCIAYLNKSYFDCDKPPTSVEIEVSNLQVNVNQEPVFKKEISAPLELIVINLSNNFITDLGNSLQDLKAVKSLNLDGNKLTAIDDVAFSNFKYINRISVRNNSLSRIGENVFMNKINLMHLDLSHNKLLNLKLTSMPSLGYVDLCNNNISLTNLMMYNVTLKTLHLCSNNVTSIPGHYFQNVSSLTELNLANNNLQLTTSSFYSLDRLEALNLSSTNLSTLPLSVFTTLKSLRVLDLSSNHFTSLDDNTFTGLVNLNTLDLSGNLLEIFHSFSIRPLKNLQVLDLANNKLEHIDYELIFSQFPTLSYFNIQSNLLTCNFLLKIVSYFVKRNITYTTSDPVDFAKENVGGIYCSNKNATEQAMLKNGSASYGGGSSIFFDFGMLVVTILCAIIIAVAVFRIYVYLKRRQYRADEFELVEE